MAVDKLVDSAQLDADLTSVADAIRLKSGGSSPLSFPAGFISEIANIPAGYTAADWLDKSKPTGGIVSDINPTTAYSLHSRTGITALRLTMATGVAQYLCYGATSLTTFVGIRATGISTGAFQNCSALTICDILGGGSLSSDFINGAACSTLILRSSSLTSLGGYSFRGNTYFAQNTGIGGTIYIPKSLYDHLGDGSNLDYKAALNWVNHSAQITWAQIEGSYYEDHYADGTVIAP